MVAHSICQDGIGFPFLSPTCYWYLVGGEEKAVEFVTTDSAAVVTKVWMLINKASTDEELNILFQSDVCSCVFERCGITHVKTF